MRRSSVSGALGALLVLGAGACPAEEGLGPPGASSGTEDGSTGEVTGGVSSSTGSTTTSATASSASSEGTSASATSNASTTADETTDAAEGWIEVGWGLDAFTPFEEGGGFPVYRGTQGLYMFTMPLRGGGFPLPPDPSDFTHPDIPVLDVWVDVEGYDDGPDGHFVAYTDYPVPFSVDLSNPGVVEYISVWLVLPDTVDPAAMRGLPAQLHAELSCADGQVLTAHHALVVGEIVEPGA